MLRNVDRYALVPGISKKDRIELMNKIEKCCEEFQNEWQGTFYKLETISDSEKKII